MRIYEALYTTFAYGVDTPWADKQNRDVYNHTPRAFPRCFVLDISLIVFQDFRPSKPKRKNTPLPICLSPPTYSIGSLGMKTLQT
ncbi:MAG: hypothetical protein IJZ40_02025 [Bacteroidaceae bacterium]|nr:hypothetical protein [Bacteroidaceae bacterium]